MSSLRQVDISVAPMMEGNYQPTLSILGASSLSSRHSLYRNGGFSPIEKPLILQLGGNNPNDLAECAKIAQQYGYDGVNLNCGCPSSRVAGNEFGASLMLKPQLVREIFVAMQNAVTIPVTIKCRLGCDDQDDYCYVRDFVNAIPECKHFIIHARNCILKGLNSKGKNRGGLTPEQNRCIPKLKHDYVYKLVNDFPDKKFTLNGEVKDIAQSVALLKNNPGLFGVMIGRAAWHDISILSHIDNALEVFNSPINNEEGQSDVVEPVEDLSTTRRKVIEEYIEYCEQNKDKHSLSELMRPLTGLVIGVHNSGKFRGTITQSNTRQSQRSKDLRFIAKEALGYLPDTYLDSPIS